MRDKILRYIHKKKEQKKILNSPLLYKDNTYWLNGINLKTFFKDHHTPAYIYDLDHIEKKYRELSENILWKDLKIFYAMKANYNVEILKRLKQIGANLDTVSPAEVILARKLGFEPNRIIFTSNNITDEEMHLVHKQGVLFNIDSLSRLEKYGKSYPGTRICLRFNPQVKAGEHKALQTAGKQAKFGMLFSDLNHAKEIIQRYSLKVVGLHEHTGSGIAKKRKIFKSMKNLLGIATPKHFPDLEFIDFGGGFKVQYSPHEHRIDYKELGTQITQIFSTFCKKYGQDLRMIFEPGKYLVAESGLLIVQVNTIKYGKNHRVFIGTNSGFPQLIRPVMYGAYHHIINLSNPEGSLRKYDICGNICETGDVFAHGRFLPEIREGDYLAILNAGAYCYSMGGVYNLRPMPSEYVVTERSVHLSTQGLTEEELVDRILKNSK